MFGDYNQLDALSAERLNLSPYFLLSPKIFGRHRTFCSVLSWFRLLQHVFRPPDGCASLWFYDRETKILNLKWIQLL